MTFILFIGGCIESFVPSHGIRQDDPISPYIFILCIEYLVHLIQEKVESKAWKGVTSTRNSFSGTHLLFVDAILLMGTTSPSTICSIKAVLDAFCKESGMKFNLEKSKVLFSRNTSGAHRYQACSTFNINATYDLGKYLGFPISLSLHKEKDFSFVVEKVWASLAWTFVIEPFLATSSQEHCHQKSPGPVYYDTNSPHEAQLGLAKNPTTGKHLKWAWMYGREEQNGSLQMDP
ncbi:hypothetical protein CRG98_032800 [Punica granatum]|uniref:Reverse transcriptase domain-containing protein n=1 Tax=Punica granatum TaxID=22663 RepID=A0A2I0ISX0_PUNGR|nr:hypothetical protein CRG98_032800 [Punica granatum]